MGQRPEEQVEVLLARQPAQDLVAPALSLVRELQKEGGRHGQHAAGSRGDKGALTDAVEALPDPPEEGGVHAADAN